MQSKHKDWAFAHAAVEDLQAYLLSKELYWQLSAMPGARAAGQVQTLTPGNLLLSLKMLGAKARIYEQQFQVEVLFNHYEAIRRQWRSAWLQKANRELQARLNLWQEYLAESASDGGRLVDYPFQVRSRTILDLLIEDGAKLTPALSSLIIELDEQLKIQTCEAPFVWDDDAKSGFPSGLFWYLYRMQRTI